ncbi:sensor histidine kinase [Shewanella algae]|uniref:sensor histidine kinase n=1 Tax=Shewanella algae TaxID=38313 RepID=UPI003B676EBC
MDILAAINEIKDQGLSPGKQKYALEELYKSASEEDVNKVIKSTTGLFPIWFRFNVISVFSKAKPKKVNAAIDIVYSMDDSDVEGIKSQAISENIGQIIHELEPIVGALELAARREVPDIAISKTMKNISILKEMLEVFDTWRKAEKTPVYKTVNVYQLISEELEKLDTKEYQVNLLVEVGFLFETDEFMLRTILSNGLRNAFESMSEVSGREVAPLIISAGVGDDFYWLSIVDDGIGLSKDFSKLASNRFSTKSGDRGFGLGIIMRMVKALKGSVDLKESNPNGAVLYVQLPFRDSE